MGKPKKGRRVEVVSQSVDLDTFNAIEQSKLQQKQTQPATQVSQLSVGHQAYTKALEQVTEGELQHYYYLDNKMIEAYCCPTNLQNLTSQQEVRETLDEDVFLFYIRQNLQELEYVLSLPFGKFWAALTKNDKVISFLDSFLSNVRRVNDTYKLQVEALGNKVQKKHDPFTLSTMGGSEPSSQDVVEHVNVLLKVVFQIFARISLVQESDELKFPIATYQDLVYQNMLFDIAKLYDIAAVFGPQNPLQVKKLIGNVFENDLRYLQEFKESVDMIITLLKKCFNAALKVSEMINGDVVMERSRTQQDEVIKRLLLDLSEILTNIELTTTCFPESILETVRNTTLPIFMANVFCLMVGPVKKLWLRDSDNKKELEVIRKSLKKLAIESCITILDVTIVKCVNVFTKNFAVVQNRLAQSLKQFLFGVTGNIELTKDSLHRNQNYLTENNSGQKFLRKIISEKKGDEYAVDLVSAIHSLEERFLDEEDKNMALMILKSLARGQTVNVQKVGGPAPQLAFGSKELNPVDKDNMRNLFDLLAGQFSRAQIEQVYLQNNKSMETTLDQFLTGQIQSQEEKIVVSVNEPVQIDTVQSQPKDIQMYVMEEYRDILFPKKVSKFTQKASMDHQRALAQMQIDEEESNKEAHRRIIELSQEMQYDDDVEESKVKVYIPQKAKPIVEPIKVVQQVEDSDDDMIDDVQMFIERQSSNIEDKPIDYLGMEESPKERKVTQVQPKVQEENRGGRGGRRGGDTQRKDDAYSRPQTSNKGGGQDNKPQRNNRGGGERGHDRARGGRTQNRGGYRDDFQRDVVDKDHEYTTENPLDQPEETKPRGGANRGRGTQQRRGGAHNQKAAAARKTGLYQQPQYD